MSLLSGGKSYILDKKSFFSSMDTHILYYIYICVCTYVYAWNLETKIHEMIGSISRQKKVSYLFQNIEMP